VLAFSKSTEAPSVVDTTKVLLIVRGKTLLKAMFPNSSPSSVMAVPLLRWAKLMTILKKENMGFRTPKDNPHCVEAERKTPFTPKEMTVKRQEGQGKT
jgi:hypothetical protein